MMQTTPYDLIRNNPDWEFFKKHAPHDKGYWVKIWVILKKNDTSEIRKFQHDTLWDEETNAPFVWIWQEGNFSCDCNRELFFRRAGNEPDPEMGCDCTEGKYSVNLRNPKTGQILYKEFDPGEYS